MKAESKNDVMKIYKRILQIATKSPAFHRRAFKIQQKHLKSLPCLVHSRGLAVLELMIFNCNRKIIAHHTLPCKSFAEKPETNKAWLIRKMVFIMLLLMRCKRQDLRKKK